ncbi:MAG: ATP-dependent DNA helicase, partial [Kiritimatiellia bacterium]|nr:ATP-dependent DNA helicase [Kiritimatiellia bacterium]
MIASVIAFPNSEEEPRLPLPDRAAGVFIPGGSLSRGCEANGLAFEVRPQQETMARAIAVALTDRRHLAVEAGTGVGKSFAYLAPLLLQVAENGQRAVVSTYTISLQEQLIRKDLPFLRKYLGVEFEAVLVKGRGNYLCRRRLARAARMERDLFPDSEAGWIERLREWAEETEGGTLQDLSSPPPPDVWDAVRSEEGNCLGAKCALSGSCFFMKARRRMHRANLLVVNHHLLFSDLALRQRGGGFLPEFDALVLDEAHQTENVAAERLGLRLTPFAFEHWMRRLY